MNNYKQILEVVWPGQPHSISEAKMALVLKQVHGPTEGGAWKGCATTNSRSDIKIKFRTSGFTLIPSWAIEVGDEERGRGGVKGRGGWCAGANYRTNSMRIQPEEETTLSTEDIWRGWLYPRETNGQHISSF